MWYGPPATVSPVARPYVALTPSAIRKPEPLPVVSGEGSAAPYVFEAGLVVQVAVFRLIVKSAVAPVTNVELAALRVPGVQVIVYGLPATVSPAVRLQSARPLMPALVASSLK